MTQMTDSRSNLAPEQDPGVDSRLIWAMLFFVLAVYAKFPALDLSVSSRYFDVNQGFIHAKNSVVQLLYDWTPPIGRGLALLAALHALFAPLIATALSATGWIQAAQSCNGRWRHVSTVFLCAALLGPGLVIEGFFKNTMGRPRPVQTVPFGGPEAFQSPFERGDNPGSHRSFCSSHAAAGFALMGLGLTCGPTWRRRWFLIGLVAGAAIGAGRIMQGGHFLSDVIFSFYSVWISCELVAWLDRKRLSKGRPPPPHRPTL
jgi:lipid A 4'-phosphatase